MLDARCNTCFALEMARFRKIFRGCIVRKALDGSTLRMNATLTEKFTAQAKLIITTSV